MTQVAVMNFLQKLFPLFFLALFFPQPAASTNVPHEIAGIKLGTSVENYPNIEYSNYLKEVVVIDWHGFRKGIISYGICDTPGNIVKIRMKYEDSSRKYFNTLLKKFKNKFGSPTEWKGDSFGIKHVWKWKFKDTEGNFVNLILQHNLQDHNENIGNMVKLSYPEMVEQERLCFIRYCEESRNSEHQKEKEALKETSWDFLIPN